MAGKGITMDHLDSWGWEGVEKMNALLDMESDQTNAWRTMLEERQKEKQ